jgi:pimeloyl-ACP methyl ester carboxylesterase
MHSNFYPFQINYIRINGADDLNIAFCDEGNGEKTLLFVHGLANCLPVWAEQIKQLSKQYRCVAIDLPGNGLSSHGGYPYSMFFYAETIRQFIVQQRLQNIILIGHSMGGQIGMVASLRYPYLFEKLVLMAPAGIEYFHAHEQIFMIQLLGLGEYIYSDAFHLEQTIREGFYMNDGKAEKLSNELKKILQMHKSKAWKNMCKRSIEAMLTEQVQSFLPQLQLPVLMLFGKEDKLIPNRIVHPHETTSSIANKGAALIPNCTHQIIPDCGHFLQIEKPEIINKLISNFAD